MSVFRGVGPTFLFRWLFGSHKSNKAKRDVSNTNVNPADRDCVNDMDSHNGYGSYYDYGYFRYDN